MIQKEKQPQQGEPEQIRAAEERVTAYGREVDYFNTIQLKIRKRIKRLKRKDAEIADRDSAASFEQANRVKPPTTSHDHQGQQRAQEKDAENRMKVSLKKTDAAQNIIESNARGLDKVEIGSEEEAALYDQITEQYDIWVNAKTATEDALSGMIGSDTAVYGLRLSNSTVMIQRAMSKTSRHFSERLREEQDQDQEENWNTATETLEEDHDEDAEDEDNTSGEDLEDGLDITDEIPNKKCSTPFKTHQSRKPKAPEKRSSTVSFKDLGQETFANGLLGGKGLNKTSRNKNLGSMRSQAQSRYDEQSFLDQNTLLDNLSTRKSKKVSWEDFFSKRHSRRYYCPEEKRVSHEYKHRVTFSGRNPADWQQAKRIIMTMILTRRYMNFDEKLLRLQEMMTDKAAFMIKDADQDEDGLFLRSQDAGQ
jgi:hypothetical protein